MPFRTALDVALDNARFPAMASHTFVLTDPDVWYETCSLVAKRYFSQSEEIHSICRDLRLTSDSAQDILGLVSRPAVVGVQRHYVRAIDGRSVPPLPSRESVWVDAIKIGRAMYRVAQRRRFLARFTVSVFASAMNTDRQVVFLVGSARHAVVVRRLIDFVRDLDIDDLDIRLVGYKDKEGHHADFHAVSGQLHLANDTPMRTENARNVDAGSPVRQAGIEVVRSKAGKLVPDQAFYSALILGAAVETWRFGLLAPPATNSGLQTASSPGPIGSGSKPQHGSETGDADERHGESVLNGAGLAEPIGHVKEEQSVL